MFLAISTLLAQPVRPGLNIYRLWYLQVVIVSRAYVIYVSTSFVLRNSALLTQAVLLLWAIAVYTSYLCLPVQFVLRYVVICR